jgi:glycosyltransferase involved in cell wall biosynthesis
MNALAAPAASFEARRNTSPLPILSLCCLYPNLVQPGQGLFIHRRLQCLAELADLKVFAPFAVVQYGNRKGQRVRLGNRACPIWRQDGKIVVWHPRWFYPPFSGSLTPLWLALQLVFRLARLRKEFPFELIDTHFGYPEGIAGAILSSWLGVPFTMTLRGNEPKHSRSWLGRQAMRWALHRAGRVFAVSERLRQFALETGAGAGKVTTIPNGVDAAIFHPRDRAECRMRHSLPLDRPIILSAGALVERKGHHRIMEALRSLAADGCKAHLVIAGGPGPEGEYEKKLRGLVAASGLESRVILAGAVSAETLAELMSAADIFCLASTNEGWPNVVHEALACGTPVVATDVGAIPEMLADPGNGVIIPVNDSVRLQRALATALETHWDRTAISRWGHARSWTQVAGEVLQEMQAMVTEKRGAKSR